MQKNTKKQNRNQLIKVYNLINQLCPLLRYRAIKLTRPSIDMAGTYHCKVCLEFCQRKKKQKKCLQNFDCVPSHTSQVLFLYHCKVYLKFCPKKIVLFVNTWFPALRSPALFPRRWQRRTCWSSPQSPRAASHSNACPDPRLGKENYFWGNWTCCKNVAGERHV